ncbi:MAG TPA: biopolymer transporter ExbD [Geobacteraceae bacterium]
MDLFRRRRIEAHIDMTPMVDTLLQLFLIFMVGASLASPTIDIDLPRAKKDVTLPNEATRVVVVSIDAGNRVYLDKSLIPRNRLKADLRHMVQSSKELTVLLRADKKLVYEQIIQVMVEIQETGATKVQLAYYPDGRSPTENL